MLSDDSTSQTQTVSLTYNEALDLDTGDTFIDPTVAAVVFCDFGRSSPHRHRQHRFLNPVALLVLLGLTGLYVAWKLAQRKGKRSIGLWIVMLLSAFVLVSSGVEWLTAQSNLTCTLVVERDGSGSGVVRGGAIDCGASCSVSYSHGELLHLKAIPDESSAFSGWLVNGDPYTGLIHIQGDTVLTALFEIMPNESPIAVNDAYTTDEDVPLQVPAAGVLSNDSDPNDDALQAVLVQEPSHGELTLQPDGSFSYKPDAYFSGVDHFLYRVHDGDLNSAVAVASITVNPVENPPTAQDLSVETAKNMPVEIELIGIDPDGDVITYQVIDGPEQAA
jgi:VCBS repeat-containing protein